MGHSDPEIAVNLVHFANILLKFIFTLKD